MHDPLRQHLHDLPDTEPSDALWTRIDGARRKQLNRRRGLLAGGATACAGAAATLFFGFGHLTNDDVARPGMVATTPSPASTPAPVASPESLHHIDRELQLAYARNADDAELASLWAVRRDVLQSRTENVHPLGI